jgi:competence protein ComEC
MPDPLLAPLAGLAAGLVLGRFVVFGARELLWAIGVLAVLTLYALWKSTRRVAMLACLAALLLAGVLLAVAHRPGPPPELDTTPREVVILSGCVVNPPVFSEDRAQFLLELGPGARAQINLFLKPGQQPPDLRYGQKVEIEARPRRIRNFRNPGSFDYAGYMARRNIYWTASARAGAPVKALPGGCGTAFGHAIFGLRVAALERLERLYHGDDYKTTMMQAVLIGESSNMEKVWTDDFRRTGTYHALVISGLHVAVLAGFFLFLLRLAFVPEPAALLATSLSAWLYALVSGWNAPAIRAAAGFTLFAVARCLFRRPRILNLLAATALGFLVCDPEQMFEASFQLSFLSVAIIGALAIPLLERTSGPLARGLAGLAERDRDPALEPRSAHFRVELRLLAETFWLWTRIPQKLWLGAMGIALRAVFWSYDMAVLSISMQLGLALPMAVYFHRISLTGLSANVLIVPPMAALVPVGFTAIFTNLRAPAILAGWLLSFSRWAAQVHARAEPDWRIPDPPLWLAFALTAALLAMAVLRRRRVAFLYALCAWAGLLLLAVVHPFAPRVVHGALELTAIDVGQGDSLFVAFPDGKEMVLDGGGIPSFGRRQRTRLDIGEDVVSPYLWSRSIRRVDVVGLSHAHADHIGGLTAIIENFRPKELWIGAMGNSPEWLRLRETALRHGVKIVPLVAGQAFRYGGTEVEVLAPFPDYVATELAHNNDSLALRLSFGRHSFLLTGDIERPVERKMLAEGSLKRTDVLKVAHHGSKTSSTAAWVEAVQPAFGLISAGFENAFHHPSPEVLKRLEEHHVSVMRTDLWGLLSIRSDGWRFQVETMRWSEPGGLYSAF